MAQGTSVVRELITVLGFQVDDAKIAAAERALAGYKNQAQAVTSTNDGMLSRMQALAGGWLGLQGAMTAGRFLFNANVEFESLAARLKTVTGGAEQGAEAFAMLEDYAVSTPFEMNQVVSAFIRLKSLGIQPTTELLTRLGDISAAMGANIEDIAHAVQGAVTGEYESLKRFGIVARSEGEKVTFTYNNVAKTVDKNRDSIVGYLHDLGAQAPFVGGMAEMSSTLGGVLSNLSDAASKAARAVGEGGMNDALRQATREMTDLIGASPDGARALGETLGEAVTALSTALQFLARNGEAVRLLLYAYGSTRIVAGLISLGTWLGSVATATGVLGAASVATTTALEAEGVAAAGAATKVGALGSAVGLAGAAMAVFAAIDVTKAMSGQSSFLVDDLIPLWREAGGVFETAANALDRFLGVKNRLMAGPGFSSQQTAEDYVQQQRDLAASDLRSAKMDALRANPLTTDDAVLIENARRVQEAQARLDLIDQNPQQAAYPFLAYKGSVSGEYPPNFVEAAIGPQPGLNFTPNLPTLERMRQTPSTQNISIEAPTTVSVTIEAGADVESNPDRLARAIGTEIDRRNRERMNDAVRDMPGAP